MKNIPIPLSWKICCNALAWYVAITTPTLLIPVVFVYSTLVAVCGCIISGPFFQGILWMLKKLHRSIIFSYHSLFFFIPFVVWLALELLIRMPGSIANLVIDNSGNIWDAGILLLFPVIAIGAGWLAVYRYRKTLFRSFLNYRYDTSA